MVSQSHSRMCFFVFLTLICLFFLNPNPTASAVGASSTLVFATVAARGTPSLEAKRYEKLLRALGAGINRKVVFQAFGSFEELSKAMNKGSIDIVAGGPTLYLENDVLYDPVARPIFRNKSRYRGVVFVKRDSKCRSLQDLKASPIGVVSKLPFSGYLHPSMLFDRGEGANRIRFYHGDEVAVVRAVARGEVVAGAVTEDAFKEAKAFIKQMRILRYTEFIPTDPVLVRTGLPLSLRLHIADFFSEAARRSDGRDLFASLDKDLQGWVRTDAKDYESLRRSQKNLKMPGISKDSPLNGTDTKCAR